MRQSRVRRLSRLLIVTTLKIPNQILSRFRPHGEVSGSLRG